MADGIRGNDYLDYPEGIQKGIILHREIDTFTDSHPIFRQSKHRIQQKYNHYSGVIIDLYYDHFLAKNWSNYSATPLAEYVNQFYELLQKNQSLLSPRMLKICPVMIEHNWLLDYASFEGISKILMQMDYRTKMKSNMSEAPKELWADYDLFENEFTSFFEELILYCDKKKAELNN